MFRNFNSNYLSLITEFCRSWFVNIICSLNTVFEDIMRINRLKLCFSTWQKSHTLSLQHIWYEDKLHVIQNHY